ncbi:TerB N-terminal domain-containing protein [Mesorhizobium sp. WSM4962]|uniref:tellurite resistance TerB family protein n=1 Tax=unclassified Mesorhizobium TaxID=325217 RepID=UPI0030146D31
MEWFLIGAALVAWLIYLGRKQSLAEEAPQRSHRSVQDRSAPTSERIASPQQPWQDPRSHPGGRFTEGSNQWERRPVTPSMLAGDSGRQSKAPAKWIASGESVRVAGVSINSGMFYLGASFAGKSGAENCLVDPTCHVGSVRGDPEGRTLPYWPSYQSISPGARRTYLEWLAGSRNDPSIGIGYVFIFFYGLERRLFVDEARNEAPAMAAEVRRLLALHGENYSFKGYVSKFLDVADLMANPDISRPALSPDLRSGYEMPLSVRLHLGRKLGSKLPFDSTDALLWVLSLPDTQLRKPAARCFEELAELWHVRFASRYPDGLKVNSPRTKIKVEYRAASGGFGGRVDLSDSELGPLPDVAALSAPIDGLRDLLNACTDELAAYSRLLGKKPEAKDTVEAAFLLPKEILMSGSRTGAAALKRVDDLFGDHRIAGVKVTRLAQALGMEIPPKGKLGAVLCNQIGALMDKLDVGFEPDRRYGSRGLEADGYILLFKAKEGAPVDGEFSAYAAARAMVEVAALAAVSDGKVEPSEFESIKADIRSFPGVGGVERGRLMAYASTLLRDPAAQQSAIKKLGSIGADARASAVRSATSAVLADGHAAPDEVKFLERLYKALGYPVEDLYSALHRGSVALDEPVAVAPETRAIGIPIPAQPPAPPSGGVRIDRGRLERIKSETTAVSELLAGIFIEEEPPASPPQIREPVAAEGKFAGLDGAHAKLLSLLAESGELDRQEFEDEARKLRLLPDGAIETINEWGFDRFDEPIVDSDERVSVGEHLRDKLQQARVEA